MRRVVVLTEAAEDIEAARDFYDAQQPGIGDYCADSVVADIESLALYHGIHLRQFRFYRMLASRSRSASITGRRKPRRKFARFWT